MHSLARQLLGQWIVELVFGYFSEQKMNHGDKLFGKIVGVDDAAWQDVLNAFRAAEPRMSKFYQPIIRTLAVVDGFESYQCGAHETSTWLRNNTPSGSALLILMNEKSAEAQSLENIFTIDEARLLSEGGLEVLYRLLADQYQMFSDELKVLKQFFRMYSELSEPQLRSVLMFLTAVTEQPSLSIIDKIQRNMDQLMLFRDHKFSLTREGAIRFKRNYQLSRLEKDGKSSKKEDFIDNLYQFLEREDENQYIHELWERVRPDEFRQHALDFIYGQSNELLQYEYETISSVFLFRTKGPTLNEKIYSFKTVMETERKLTQEQDQLFTDALEAIKNGNDPEKIREFVDEFAFELDTEPKVRKDLERIIDRQRQLHEYADLTDALLQEAMMMLEEYAAEHSISEVSFKLRILESQVSERTCAFLRFHLFGLKRLTGHIEFEESSLRMSSDQEKEGDISLQLMMLIEGKEVIKCRFKLLKGASGQLSNLIDNMRDCNYIPYVKEYQGPEIKLENVLDEVKRRVDGYIATNTPGVIDAYQHFRDFVVFYTDQLQGALEQGLCSLDYTHLEKRLEDTLNYIHESALVSKHIFQYLSYLGAVDVLDCKSNERVGVVQSRVLTLLNPIRLLSYAKRLSRVGIELKKWIEGQDTVVHAVGDMNAYIQQLHDETAHLAPQYFVQEGIQGQFLIEQQERMGEGTFALNGRSSGEEQLVDTFAEEFLSTVKTYLEVYPYARDCLDIVFLYCPHAEYVTSAIDQIFKQTKVSKVKAVIHSKDKGAAIHEYLNNWVVQEEQYSERFYSFPKVEIQVIAEQDINALMKSVTQHLHDADLGVLVNYFGQTSHIQYRLEKVPVKDSNDWFGTIYREPLKKDDAVKRISYISESLPKVLQYFYRMQYILHSSEATGQEDHYLLRNVISIAQLSDQQLINFMHEQFNWSLFIDRYLDKSLLRQVSSKAQIIKYKSRAGKNKDYRTLLSSSKYIRKLASEEVDHEYYDRLYQKYVLLLKNDKIDSQLIVQAVERVKEISGGVVLRAIGPGKFAHEMMAIYLSTQARLPQKDELVIWSVCDELPWFQGSGRRPDLVRTVIERIGERIHIHFDLVELKFISHTIFDDERYDAIKQVKAGLDLYKSRFMFQNHPSSAEVWRKELIYYLLEFGTYSVEHALLLKELQSVPIANIDVTLAGEIDTFVYTSNLLDINIMDGHVDGHQTEVLQNEYVNHIYNRSYILRALGAMQENVTPSYEEIQEFKEFVSDRLGMGETSEGQEIGLEGDSQAIEAKGNGWSYAAAAKEESGSTEAIVAIEASIVSHTHSVFFPEQVALAGEAPPEDQNEEDIAELVDGYQKKLRFNFSQIGIPIKIIESFVGVSVIRIVFEIPPDKSFSSIEKRSDDIYLWLKLSSVPLIALRQGRIHLDINREKPATVYFESFMERVRADWTTDRLKGKLVAPLGVGQLGEVITMDFSSPDTPHLLIGGRTGSGKSVTINSIILAMMCLYEPSEVQFLFIDPKKVEFRPYENWKHTTKVIMEIEEAIVELEQLVEEMNRRYRLFAQEFVDGIAQYVETTANYMPRLIVVFDEFADFMSQEKSLSSRVENAIQQLGQKARAAGIHLLICTQNPKADIVPTNIRNNLPARLALRATDHHASKIILDEEGAEKLGGKGDFLAKLDAPEVIRAKSPFLTPRVKRGLQQYFRKKEQIEDRPKG